MPTNNVLEPNPSVGIARRAIWQKPWGYPEAWWLSGAWLVLGFWIQWTSYPQQPPLLSWPNNLLAGLGLVVALVVVHARWGRHPLVQLLRSTQQSMVVMGLYLLLIILMGSLSQDPKLGPDWVQRLGLRQLTESWPFILLNLYFLTVLGLVSLHRWRRWNARQIAFFANHFGIWLVVWAAALGSGDLQRMRMTLNLHENKPVFWAHDGQADREVAVAARLLEFRLEEYPPKLTVIDNTTGQLQHQGGRNLNMIDTGLTSQFGPYQLEVIAYLPQAVAVGERFFAVNEPGSPPAAQIVVRHQQQIDTGWVSCGSYARPPKSHRLDERHSVVMTVPEARKYQSSVVLYAPDGRVDTAVIEVNKPYHFANYTFYQLSYDTQRGRWSETSVLELVHDPWQPVVYTGIFLLLAGAAYLLYRGRAALVSALNLRTQNSNNV